MMKQMKSIATKTLLGAQEIKVYMKRATITSFGITMGLFGAAFGLSLLVNSLMDEGIVLEPPLKFGSGTTVILPPSETNTTVDVPNLIQVPIDIYTTIVQGTQQVAGNFVAVPDMNIAIDAADIASFGKMSNAAAELGDTKLDDVSNLEDVVFGDKDDFVIDGTQIPPKPEEEYEEWEIAESPGVDVSQIASNIVYPRIAKEAGIEGTVILEVLIGPDGKIAKLKVINSDNAILNEAAISAVKKSTYTPGIQNGNPCACWVSIPIEFNLR